MSHDHSQLIGEFLTGPPEDVTAFFRWVATLQSGHDDRGWFILDTKRTLNLGGDPASEVRVRGLRHVTGPFRELLTEWRAAGSPR